MKPFQILTKCIELFPELFNSSLPAPDNDLAISCAPPLPPLPPPDWSQRSCTLEVSPDAPSPPVHKTPPPPANPSYPLVSAPHVLPPVPASDVPLSPDKLNYQAIHEELEGHSVRGKLLLLQALRWVKTNAIFQLTAP